MIITPLGHTEFLVDIENGDGENIRILVDAWLSDYAFGDLMERTTKVRLDSEKIGTIDAIYISHAHCDHFDPYSLSSLLKGAPRSGEGSFGDSGTPHIPPSEGGSTPQKLPLLLLPFTLRYLEPLLLEYLPHVQIHWLENHKAFTLRGVEITGHMWPNPEITNEDDVMMIAISNDRELLFAEIDTVPDEYSEEVQKSLYKVFTRKKYETACYIASRNCLEGQIPYYDLSEGKRKPFRDKYISDQKEGMEASYEKYDYEEYAHFPNLFTLSGFVRGFIGQGIHYPREMSPSLADLALFPLDELVSIEADYAKNAGYEFSQKALLSGRQYKIENGIIEQGRKDCPIGELIVNRKSGIENRDIVSVISSEDLDSSFGASRRIHVPETPGSFTSVQDDGNNNSPRNDGDGDARIFASGPLIPREFSEQLLFHVKPLLQDILNTRFLPYWSASPVASLRDVLIRNDGLYRIEFKVKSETGKGECGDSVISTKEEILPGQAEQDFSLHSKGQRQFIFEYSTARSCFIEVPYEEGMRIDEDYWMADIVDFLEGRQEMYSSFWHRLDPKRVYRLWTCLGASFMNHDLNIAKYRLHFELAKQGKTAEDFVGKILQNIHL